MPLAQVTQSTQAIISSKQKFVFGLIGLLLLGGTVFYSQQAAAETTVSGVEIEIINEPVSGDLVGDSVQDYLADVEANNQDDFQNDFQDDFQNDLWSRIKDGYAMPNIESAYTSKHQTWYASRQIILSACWSAVKNTFSIL